MMMMMMVISMEVMLMIFMIVDVDCLIIDGCLTNISMMVIFLPDFRALATHDERSFCEP